MQSLWWWGCRVDWISAGPDWNRMKPGPGQTYPKLFHLFFLQARGVKIEAWLKDKFRGRGGQDYVEVMPQQTNGKWLEMGGHQTYDISPYQPEKCVSWPCASHTHENRSLWHLLGFFPWWCWDKSKIKVLWKISSLTSCACSMKGVSAGGSHALQQWQTVINTQTEWYELHTAVGINSTSLPVDPCLVSSRRYIPAEECNRTNKSHEPDRKWMGIDRTRPWACARSCWWRIQVEVVDVWCSGCLFAHICSLLY